MARDVLEEGPFWSDLGDDACHIRPEVAGIVFAEPRARERERLARITGSDDMNAAAPRSAVEGLEIVPDKSRSQGRICHPGHEDSRCETVSLDKAHSAISGLSDVQAEIQSSDTGAKADSEKLVMSFGGTNSHKEGLLITRSRRSGLRGQSPLCGVWSARARCSRPIIYPAIGSHRLRALGPQVIELAASGALDRDRAAQRLALDLE